jgi:hypothetical protein
LQIKDRLLTRSSNQNSKGIQHQVINRSRLFATINLSR